MASRQLPERWYHQTGNRGIKSEAGETQPIRPTAQASHGMEMPADVEQFRSGWNLRSMAQPQMADGLGGELRQAFDPGMAVVVAADQEHLTTAEIRQATQGLAQFWCQPLAGMNQITQNNELLWSPGMTKLEQRIQCSAVAIGRYRDAMGLENLSFAQVQIRHHQLSSLLPPKGSFAKKTQGLAPPDPLLPVHPQESARFCNPDCIAGACPCITVMALGTSIVARSMRPNQLPVETLRWLERRLASLEQQGRYECAYALRMEVAEWLLGAMDANLAVPAAT